jgi:hypothetical protein
METMMTEIEIEMENNQTAATPPRTGESIRRSSARAAM